MKEEIRRQKRMREARGVRREERENRLSVSIWCPAGVPVSCVGEPVDGLFGGYAAGVARGRCHNHRQAFAGLLDVEAFYRQVQSLAQAVEAWCLECLIHEFARIL